MQIPHHLIERRRKTRVHIQEHAIPASQPQSPTQITHDLLEALRATNATHLLAQRGRAPDGHEPHRDLGAGKLAGGAQR